LSPRHSTEAGYIQPIHCPGDLTLFSFNLFISYQAEEGRELKKEYYRSEIRDGGQGSTMSERILSTIPPLCHRRLQVKGDLARENGIE
jgi:hypothetical protein